MARFGYESWKLSEEGRLSSALAAQKQRPTQLKCSINVRGPEEIGRQPSVSFCVWRAKLDIPESFTCLLEIHRFSMLLRKSKGPLLRVLVLAADSAAAAFILMWNYVLMYSIR
jgi:hypothetical protein